MIGESNRAGFLSEISRQGLSQGQKDSPPHSCQRTCWASQDRAESPLRPPAPHLRLVSLRTQLKNTGQPLRPEEQSQGQDTRISMLWWLLADVPLQGVERPSSVQVPPSWVRKPPF